MTTPPGTPRWTAYVPLEQLRPAVRNPQQHDKAGIRASVDRHGFADQPIVDERTMRLVAGHGRVEDLVDRWEAGQAMPDGLMPDPDGPGWLVPVQRGWSSKDDAHAEQFILLHNSLPGRVPPNVRLLLPMLDDMQSDDQALFEELRIGDDELDRMLREAGGPNVEVLPDAADPAGGEQTIDVPARPGEEADRPVTEEKPSMLRCEACGHLNPRSV